jgi:hypothetical protein
MRLLANEYNKEECSCQEVWEECTCQKHYTAKDNDACKEHFIFTEAGELILENLVETHIFTEENIAVIRKNLKGQQNYFLASALFNFQKEFEHFNSKNPDHNLIEFIQKNCKCPVFKKCHHKDCPKNGGKCPNKNCDGNGEEVNEKFRASDRYVFYFLKKLFSFADIKIAKGADLSWPQGLAIMQPYDMSQNTEMNREELRDLLEGLRKGKINVPMRKFCKDCEIEQYTNTKACFNCHGENGNLVSSDDSAYTLWTKNRSESSERSVSPMSAHRRLLQEIHRRN